MTPKVHERTQRLIARYQLHSTTPVNLSPLEAVFPVRFDDLLPMQTLGVILPPLHGWPATTRNRAKILVDLNLGARDARLTIAHEIGHGICEHVGALSSAALGLEHRHEREAWQVAAALLIPPRVVYEEREVSRIAAACDVPAWLVNLWPSIDG